MSRPVWRVEDDGDAQLPVTPTGDAGLVSLPFLIAAVRRRWRTVAVTIGVCTFLALGLMRMGGEQHSANVTLLLISDPNMDPNAAMTTNLSLATTRTVAEQTVKQLGLPMSPVAFQGTVTASPLSEQLMSVMVTAPSDREAVRRANGLASVYLAFRGQQLSALATSTIQANQERIAGLNRQIDALTTQYHQAASTPGQEQQATDLLSQRAFLQQQVSSTEQQDAQTGLASQAIVKASHVVDAAAVVHKSAKKRAVLTVMSGVIGGLALGLGLVLAPAILSTRLRRRADVARALGLSVRFSAGTVSSRWRWIPGRERRRNAETLAHGLATALPEDAATARLTLATVGDVRDGAYVVGALADALAREATAVAVLDLSASGVLYRPGRVLLGRADPIENRQLVKVHRHDVRVSELAARTRNKVVSDKDLARAEVILTLIELDLGAGVDALGELADTSVVLVSTGRVTAERLRSSATLLRQSDLRPVFAMLAGADDADDSSGLLEPAAPPDLSTRRLS